MQKSFIILNVAGNIIGSGTALKTFNYNAILNPPIVASLNYWPKSITYPGDIYYSRRAVEIGIDNPTSELEMINVYYNNFKFNFG